MMRPLILAAVLCVAASSARASIQAGDQLVSGSLGAVKATGPNRSSFVSPGWLASGEYFYQLTDAFAVGGEASWLKPHNKSVTVLAGAVTVQTNADVFTLAALGRWNFTPRRDWTPFVAAGPGLRYTAQTVSILVPSAPSLSDVQGSYAWSISGVAAAGIDYLCGHWLAGAEMRFETFGSDTGGLGWSGRLGYKFGK